MNDDEDKALEALVDKYGLSAVIEQLSYMCAAKAQHIRDNWQDTPLGGEWDNAAEELSRLSRRDTIERLG